MKFFILFIIKKIFAKIFGRLPMTQYVDEALDLGDIDELINVTQRN